VCPSANGRNRSPQSANRRTLGSRSRCFGIGSLGISDAVNFSILVHPARWLLAILEAFDASLIDLDGGDTTDCERHEGFACHQ
jgi:hypothetical protein